MADTYMLVEAQPTLSVPNVGGAIRLVDQLDGTVAPLASVVPKQGATFRVNAGATAPGQALKSYAGTSVVLTSGQTVALETVAAGKTFYITDIYVGANTATPFQVTINAAGVPIFQGFCKGDTGPITLVGLESQPSASGLQAVTLVFGTAAATTAAYLVAGFEQ